MKKQFILVQKQFEIDKNNRIRKAGLKSLNRKEWKERNI